MYTFHLDSQYSDIFACIEYSEEQSLYLLYQQDIPFITTLFEKFYTDYTFGIGELKSAQRDLMNIMTSKQRTTHHEKDDSSLQLLYKLVAIVSYALFHDSCLVGSGD